VVRVGSGHERDGKSSLATSSEGEDGDDRDTIPLSEPKARERQDATPLVNRTRARDEKNKGEVATDAAKGDLLDQVMSQMAEASHEAETWRPPANDGVAPAPRGGASKSEKPSSLAPRERAAAASSRPGERSTMPALLRVAAIFALCAGAFWVRAQWGDRSQRTAATSQGDLQDVAPRAVVAAPVAEVEPQPPGDTAPADTAPALRGSASDDSAGASAPDEAKPVARVTNGTAQAPLGTPRLAPKRTRHAAVDVSHLPEEPSRKDVIDGLNQLRGELGECSKGRSGTAEIDLTIAGSGSVTYALIAGDYAGTPQGSCIARTIRGAHFEPFRKPRVRVLYRMSL
jgi:hypothetical protein